MIKITRTELREILKSNTHNKTDVFKGVWISQGNRFADLFLKLKRIYYYTDDYFQLDLEGNLTSSPSIQIWFNEIRKITKSQHSIRIELSFGVVITLYDNKAGVN